jgi:adenylate kinase
MAVVGDRPAVASLASVPARAIHIYARCDPMRTTVQQPRVNLMLIGAPASGKGTQAALLVDHLDIPSIATGNILRAELVQRTELGLRAEPYMQRGALVPDALMIDILRQRLHSCGRHNGFLLDGFPRTVAQAQALDASAASMAIRFDRVLYLDVPEGELIRRITSRLTCPACGRSYVGDPDEPRALTCDSDGLDLVVRDDDRPTTAQRRIAVYLQNTLPVLDHYRSQGLVASVDGTGSVEEVFQRVLQSLRPRPDAAEASLTGRVSAWPTSTWSWAASSAFAAAQALRAREPARSARPGLGTPAAVPASLPG